MTTLTEIADKLRELATTLDGALDTSRMCYAIGAASTELEHIAAALDQHAAQAVKVPDSLEGPKGPLQRASYAYGWNDCLELVKKLNGVKP